MSTRFAPTKRTVVLSALMAVGTSGLAVVQAQLAPEAIRLEKVNENLYVISGGRGLGPQAEGVSGNTTMFITASGVVLVDTKYPGLGKTILDQVRSVTSKPVTLVINTHSHGDHTGSNDGMPRTAEFVAHENTKTNMIKMAAFKGENTVFLPKKTFTDRLSLLDGADRIDLYYFGRAHTNGDIVIVFPAARTAVLGDLLARKWVPFADPANGGSALEFPQTIANAVKGLHEVDTVITGHSTTSIGHTAEWVRAESIMRWADLVEYSEFMRDLMAAVQAARTAGKSVDEAVSGLKLPDRYKTYDYRDIKVFVDRVYTESKQ